jgi:hypothetical protein
MAATSMKQPFQSGYLMDISRCVERLEIAQTGQIQAIKYPLEGQFLLLAD